MQRAPSCLLLVLASAQSMSDQQSNIFRQLFGVFKSSSVATTPEAAAAAGKLPTEAPPSAGNTPRVEGHDSAPNEQKDMSSKRPAEASADPLATGFYGAIDRLNSAAAGQSSPQVHYSPAFGSALVPAPTKRYASGRNDDLWQEVCRELGLDPASASLCFRCKLLECKGLAECMFDGNVFRARRFVIAAMRLRSQRVAT